MKLMGKSKLSRLARNPSARAAVTSLWHELEEYSWRTTHDAVSAYPAAKLDGHRLIIDLGDEHCAVVGINFKLEFALVEFAGTKAGWRRRRSIERQDRKRK